MESPMRKAWRWNNEASKRSALDSVLDKLMRDLFPASDRPKRRRTSALRSRPKRRRQSYALELLEPRLLLSADPGTLTGGVLTGNLTATNNSVVVALDHSVTPNGTANDNGLIVDLSVNGVTQTYGNASNGV